jgi:hypothetical protein
MLDLSNYDSVAKIYRSVQRFFLNRYLNRQTYRSYGRLNCCWPSPAQYFSVMTIYFFSRLLHVLKWGLLFNEKKGLTTIGHSPSTGDDSSRHSLINRSSPAHTNTRIHRQTYQKSEAFMCSCMACFNLEANS